MWIYVECWGRGERGRVCWILFVDFKMNWLVDNLSERSEHNRSAQMLIHPGMRGYVKSRLSRQIKLFPFIFKGFWGWVSWCVGVSAVRQWVIGCGCLSVFRQITDNRIWSIGVTDARRGAPAVLLPSVVGVGICSESPRTSRKNTCYKWYHSDINLILIRFWYGIDTVRLIK